MAEDTPRIPSKVKGLGAKFKGLPPWAYVASVGVGGAAIWFGIQRSRANAAAAAADITGVDPNGGMLSATTGGDAYPGGSMGASMPGYYQEPVPVTPVDPAPDPWDRFIELLPFITGGGTQTPVNPADHYTPPTINVIVPEPPPVQTAPAAPAPSPAPGPITISGTVIPGATDRQAAGSGSNAYGKYSIWKVKIGGQWKIYWHYYQDEKGKPMDKVTGPH